MEIQIQVRIPYVAATDSADFKDECSYEHSTQSPLSACVIPFLVVINSFFHRLIGHLYSTKDELLRGRPGKKCAYMRL